LILRSSFSLSALMPLEGPAKNFSYWAEGPFLFLPCGALKVDRRAATAQSQIGLKSLGWRPKVKIVDRNCHMAPKEFYS
jgi:hypothetical protein